MKTVKPLIAIVVLICIADALFGQTANEWLERANKKLNNEDYEDALVDFEKVIQLNPNSYGGYYGRATTKLDLGKLDDALSDYDKAIELNPKSDSAFYQRSKVKYKQQKFEASLADISKALQVDGKSAVYYSAPGCDKDRHG